MFHGYQGAPNFSMPAVRYQTFNQTKIERIKKQQEELEALNTLEGMYNSMIQVLEKANLQNDVKINTYGPTALVSITLLKSDTLESFHQLAVSIGKAMIADGHICPDRYGNDYYGDAYRFKDFRNESYRGSMNSLVNNFSWTKIDQETHSYTTCNLQIVIPDEGTDELEVLTTTEIKSYQDTSYSVQRRNPSY
jgi:hypothetical protein